MIPDFDDRGYLPAGIHPATEFAILVEDFFATDRNEFPKGVVEVLL